MNGNQEQPPAGHQDLILTVLSWRRLHSKRHRSSLYHFIVLLLRLLRFLAFRFANSESLGTSLTISTSSPSVSTAPSASTLFVYCGRGNRKIAKGKRFNHCFGNARPRDKTEGRGPPRVPMPPWTVKKDRFDDDDKAEIGTDE